ncbi:MAG: hypothetical protein J3Q66DRAFT_331247 [Benniella sp.]|nr:MAG: hypothetical protein J3Q66DRAFT_331247 [Benniella sp.]
MPSPHPLELTEIISLVVRYLPHRSLPSCARVSKAWYQACIPHIWHHIHLKKLPKSTALIHRHRHHVRRVSTGRMSQEHTALRFTSLDFIQIETQGHVQDVETIQFIMDHPTATRLELRTLLSDRHPAFWDALLRFHNLRALTMSSLEIFGTNMDKFWQLCPRLERLVIRVHHHHLHINLPPGLYPNLKHLGVDGCDTKNVPFFMGFLRQCPHLTSIDWRTAPAHEEGFVYGLTELLEAKALPNLKHLNAGTRQIENVLFVRLVHNLPPRINSLHISLSLDVLKMDFATLFRPYFSNLRVLTILTDMSAKSPLAQIIMSSCPLLEELAAPNVDALVVVEGAPWVCSRLKVLDLAFCFNPHNAVNQLQPLIFDRLSKLTRLEELCMMGPSRRYNIGGTVDLRMTCGLGKLSTLRLLRSVIIRGITLKMDDKEVDFILTYWKSLTMFSGKLNTLNEAFNEALEERLKKGGIKIW